MFGFRFSCSLLLPLLLALAASLNTLPAVRADVPIDYKGEHSNYGDYQRIAQLAREQLLKGGSPASADDDLYYFFTLHDYNHDSHLDGHELRIAFTGMGADLPIPAPQDRLKLVDVEDMVDHVLLEDDKDNDGKISWEEYLASQIYHRQ
ncbi:hypothetical protein HDU85_003816 [Gaertneriomyces sp. JEL0708]|nr:hypothetical protein HDU85_003816 [Gaertneriomyces sp. JEL0708]